MKRIAVVLPSLPAGDPVRRSLDAVVARIADSGVQVTLFGEADRCRQDAAVTHYLKLPRHHAADPFDNALYPLGRDYRTWEAAFLVGLKLPGVTWVLDPVPGHMVVASVALRNRWDAHYEAMEAEFGGETTAIAMGVLASGWADRAFHRRFDLMVPMLRAQRAIVWRDGTAPAGEPEPEVVPLATVSGSPPGERPDAGRKKVATVLNFNARWPQPLLRAARRLARSCPDLSLALCYPEPFDGLVRSAVEPTDGPSPELAPSPSSEQLLRRVEGSDFVLLLEPEATATEMALLQHAMAAGRCVMVPEAPLFDDFASAACVRVPLGRGLETGLVASLAALVTDGELRQSVGAEARRFADRRSVDSVAAQLLEHLRGTAGPCECARPAADLWRRLPDDLVDRVAPGSATEERLRQLRDSIRPALPIPADSGG